MNRMQQQMMAVDPMQVQNQMLAAYHPAQISPQQDGQVGMGVDQMRQAVMARQMRSANQFDRMQADGGSFV